ncbi:MAG: sugar transferase, partial [Clostridia bacterium]|nr:sugar transferase [Clostridia bacterium]
MGAVLMLYALAGLFLILAIIAHLTREKPYLDADNPYLHAEAAKTLTAEMASYIPLPVPEETARPRRYAAAKRAFDVIISFVLLILLSPVYLIIAAAVALDDPGPVLFSQKRVGKNKQFFMLHKFRSMKTGAPHDVPTHLLADPDQYLTRVGRFLRNSSLDELPQVWDIFRGRMSLIGPRPALWNQADLV